MIRNFSRLLWSIAATILVAATQAASAAPIKVLPPASNAESPGPVICAAEYLRERLSECGGVDVVQGRRAARVCGWLRGGTFIYSDQTLWEKIQSYVALDAMVDVYEVGDSKSSREDVVVEARVFSAAGTKKIRQVFTEKELAELPNVMAQFGERVGRELKLSDADVKTLSQVRIEEPAFFSFYYTTKNVWGPWPSNPYLATLQTAARLSESKPHWAREAATARVVAGYLHNATHGRMADNMKQAVSMARQPVVRLLGSGHEEEARPLLELDRSKVEGVLGDIESVLLQIARPTGYGKLLEGRPKPEAAAVAGGDELEEAKPGATPAKGTGAARPGARKPGKPEPKTTGKKAVPEGGEWVQEIDDAEAMKGGVEKDGLTGTLAAPTDLSARTGQADFKPEQRLAAIRMLGVLASTPALELFKQTSQIADPVVREATATALGGYKENTGLAMLQVLATDPDEKVAFAAGRSLWLRRQPPADFRERALKMLNSPEPYRTLAAQALAGAATADDQALLDKLAADPSPAVRAAVRKARFSASAADPRRLEVAMSEPETDVVVAAIKRVPADAIAAGNNLYNQLVRLANDPDNDVAWAARDALWPLRPAAAAGRARFDLATAAPYLRQRAVRMVAQSKEPWAKAELLAACENLEAHTRIAALEAITSDADSARGPLLKATLDPHLLVRLRAASLLANVADASQAAGIRDSIGKQRDKATRLYLEDAMAKAEGRPMPTPPKGANSIAGAGNIAWLCPHGNDPNSPFQAYYAPSHGTRGGIESISEHDKLAHDKGKFFLTRISPVGNPGTIMIDGLVQDDFWRSLDSQLETACLPYIDGVVYGEESMSMATEALWPSGWRFFCDDLAIDPVRVSGDKKNLTQYESHAWTIWADRRCVEGFNRLYDYTKLKFGKLQPGFQVCTFLPEQSGPTFADFEWKFDIGGIYHYIGHTRKDAFSLVRRYKTTWPDRPVLWLSHGIGVYERTPIQYNYGVPTEPITTRNLRAYTDALTAWMAGADTGWFNIWAFLPYNWVNEGMASLRGPTIGVEDITTPESPALRRVIEFSFAGLDKFLRDKEELAKVNAKGMVVPPDEKQAKVDSLIDSLDKTNEPDAIVKKIAQDKERMYIGFQIYRKHLMDLAHLFSSLPRNNPKPPILCVQPGLTVWDGTIGSPGSDLLNYYDFQLDINQLPKLDLNRYRLIAVKSPGAITDQTIACLTKWLKETPGVLYIHLNITADNSHQYATPEAFDGKLKLDWPWESDLRVSAAEGVTDAKPKKPAKGETLTLATDTGATVTVTGVIAREAEIKGSGARVLFKCEEAPTLICWRRPDFKGAVLFDFVESTDRAYREEIRRVLNDLHDRDGLGLKIDGPQRQEMLASDQWTANTSAGSPDKHTVKGVDMLTGALNPVVGTGKNAAFVAREFKGQFAAAYNGVSVLCDAPIKKVEKTQGGLIIECDGLIQAASETGKVTVTPTPGDAIPEIPATQLNKWVLLEKTPGIAVQPTGNAKDADPSQLYYVRCKRAVTFTAQ